MDSLCLSCESARLTPRAGFGADFPGDPQVLDRFRVHSGAMAENDDAPANADDTVVSGPAGPKTSPETSPAPEPAPAGPRLVDRVWSFRAMVAVALASLILGAGIASAVAAVAGDDSDERLRLTRFSDGPGERGRGPGDMGPPGQRFDREEMKEFREQMREDLRQMRKEFREQRGEDDDPPTPSPGATG